MSTCLAYFLERNSCPWTTHRSIAQHLDAFYLHTAHALGHHWKRSKSLVTATTKDIQSTTHRHANLETLALALPPAIRRDRGGSLSLETHIPTHDGQPPSHLQARRSQSSLSTCAAKGTRPHAFLVSFSAQSQHNQDQAESPARPCSSPEPHGQEGRIS
jgi:hypothetical protein